MANFTLHNEIGDYMYEWAHTLEGAKKKCDKATYKCRVFQTYYDKSPWSTNETDKLVEHGREVYRNY